MARTISLFMWGYQPYFRVFMECRAREVLQLTAPTLQPKALLVGIRTPDKREGHPVCVEPEDNEWDPATFFVCADRAEEMCSTHPDHSILYGDVPRMRDKPENIRRKSVRQAVEEAIAPYDSSHGTVSFCGVATRVAGYHVVPILQFDAQQLREYPRLPAPVHSQGFVAPAGLLEGAILCLLDEASGALSAREPGRFIDAFHTDPYAILRNAGDSFCAAITLATGDLELQGLFEALNVISSLPYEGTGAIGELLFAPVSTDGVNFRVRLRAPVSLRDHKLARKMIEMTGRDLSCVCHGHQGISGLGVLENVLADGVFRVSFSGHYKWDLYYRTELLMHTAFGVPRLPMVPLKEVAFRLNVRRLFDGLEDEAEGQLWSIARAAMEQTHGTMIVVSARAEEEAKRLKKQSLTIEPVALTAEVVRRLSKIDGALLVDTKGVCHALGVILDGMATEHGDASRGARYNSAIRYIATVNSPTMCLVVSEDGYVNMLPTLRPQVRKSEIEKRVAQLKTENIENCHKTRTWLEEHRFYLTAEQCDVVNRELARINSAPFEVGEIRLPLSPFVPHSAMNDSYYLPEAEP